MIGRILRSRELNLGLRLLLGGMFVYAAWSKVVHPQDFAISVRAYKIVPLSLSNLFAVCVSWGELVAGAMLLLGILTRSAAGAIFVLLGMFTAAISTVLIRGMVIDCGCFGPDGGSATSPLLIGRNVLLLAAALLVILYNDGFLSVHPRNRPRRSAPSPTS